MATGTNNKCKLFLELKCLSLSVWIFGRLIFFTFVDSTEKLLDSLTYPLVWSLGVYKHTFILSFNLA